ncbi:hypothetical protein [Burkholderia multivorans]|uniref:hypothetical protein n=1 Tax=Burkholderia multivorans TaxID=87883 RepID=UPI001C23833F|nr:hypothetical protein [Burkholderia multivorans]MBU9211685.1 hypothetical protein [Burkholderia multivorans]
MEKVLLVMALLGSAHLAFLGMSKIGKLVFSFAKPRPDIRLGTVRMPDATSMAIRKDGEEDWSKYDVPAFIRRGIPMPKLEPVQAKTAKTRKRRSKAKSDAPVTPVASDTAAFEIVA